MYGKIHKTSAQYSKNSLCMNAPISKQQYICYARAQPQGISDKNMFTNFNGFVKKRNVTDAVQRIFFHHKVKCLFVSL